MPYCKVCQQEVPKLVRCHIYPHSMARELAAEDGGHLLAMSDRFGPRMSVAHAGIFDDNIACEECERRFGPADDYAVNFRRAVLSLSIPFSVERLHPTQDLPTIRLPTFRADPTRLHSFAMNTLFRSFLSERWEHDQITEAFIEQEVRMSLGTGDPTISSGREICIIVTMSEVGAYLATPHLLPHPDHPKYVLQMPKMTIFVDAGTKGLGPGFSVLALRPGDHVAVWRRRKPVLEELKWPSEIMAALGDRIDSFDKVRRKRRDK